MLRRNRILQNPAWVHCRRRFGRLAATLIVVSAIATSVLGQQPGARQTRPVAIVGATIHTAIGAPIEEGTIVFADGRISEVGTNVTLPEDAEQIDAPGKHVYPGLFCASSELGLVEISSVRATLDVRETGAINPNIQAHKAINPDSELIPVTRSNGVLLALTAPNGGLLSGQSAVFQLDGWTWEEMTVKSSAAMHVAWPRVRPVRNWWDRDHDHEDHSGARRQEEFRKLEQLFEDARAYHQARTSNGKDQPFDARLEAMGPLLHGRQPIVVHADRLQAIQEAIAFAEREQARLIILGGYDAEQAADLLKKHEVPVIVGGVYRLPLRRSDPYDTAYTLPERLRRAGVRFCIAGVSIMGASNLRNLPYHAATAVAYGLPHTEAIRAVTLYPAQILGVDDRIGSLTEGKDATLFIADGDVLETPTKVEAAYIQGRAVDLADRHKRLYSKYRRRLEQARSEAAVGGG